MLYYIITIIFIAFLDQFTKYLIKINLPLGESKNILFNILYFTHITNAGSAFGFKLFSNTLYIIIVSTSLIFLLYLLYTIKDNFILSLSYSFIIGGALGNLIDRIRYKQVTDFIDFKFFPVFNIADTFITIGVILIFIYYIFLSPDKR